MWLYNREVVRRQLATYTVEEATRLCLRHQVLNIGLTHYITPPFPSSYELSAFTSSNLEAGSHVGQSYPTHLTKYCFVCLRPLRNVSLFPARRTWAPGPHIQRNPEYSSEVSFDHHKHPQQQPVPLTSR